MERFDPSQYVTVNDRIKEFWNKYPEGRIETFIVSIDMDERPNRMVVIKASVYHDRTSDRPIATGTAKEREGTLHVNKTSFVENCETSAIGRALANLGFLIDKRPSKEEMEAVHRAEQEHTANLETIKLLAKNGDPDFKALVKASWARLKEEPVYAVEFLSKHTGGVEVVAE